MITQRHQSKEEEPFRTFLKRIQSLGNNFNSKVKEFEDSIKSLTHELSTWKKIENQVLADVAESIRNIDDLNESYEYTSQSDPQELERKKDSGLNEIINKCIEQIKKHIKNEDEEGDKNSKQGSQPRKHWWEAPEKNVEDRLLVTAPELRYNDLEPPLKRCLLFLCVFPENAIIHKKSIIYWWIGEGLMKPNRVQTAEQAGERCFKMLLLNGLILPISKKHEKNPRCCKLHSSVRQMLISEATKAGLCFEIYSNEELTKKHNKDDKCPLSCLTATTNKQSVMVSRASLKHESDEFLSLFNISAQYLVCDRDKFSKFKSIKVLQLGRWQIFPDHHIEVEDTKFLESLGIMKNLSYLSLRGISRISFLPDSLVHLTSLQILDLRACHNLEELPAGIGSLKNLIHLDVSECSLLDGMPKGLGQLSKLEVLKGFIISRSITDDLCRLKELTGLENLRKLSINIAKGAKADGDLKELKTDRFPKLSTLTITWGQVTQTPPESSPEISLPKLEKLDLQCIPQHEKLNWLKPEEFPNLKKLYIRGGKLKSLNLVGTKQWKVETLRLKFLSELEWNNWSDIMNAFPSLACAEIYECPKLKANDASLPLLDEDGFWIKKNEANLK
ncbi:disease resistance RPP13-like protein 4 [Cinnamomum micranthum f. kanehirae]|uniref:Disease resistance RPP13-like protein 4 n=1 Tax=Cinnamomum micranthum f. kanehirae TaxID=337451 RepID=A0A3S4P2H2_9MAGN|nr:disease resistance RPP13-like protein 4 [Cinnamomum micranthum f. kanehirae]